MRVYVVSYQYSGVYLTLSKAKRRADRTIKKIYKDIKITKGSTQSTLYTLRDTNNEMCVKVEVFKVIK